MEKVKCPICNNQDTKKLFGIQDRLGVSDEIFDIRKCLNCGIVFTFPILTRGDVEKFYPEFYMWRRENKTNNKFIEFLKKMETLYINFSLRGEAKRLIKVIGKKGKVLDIGCGNGMRLELLRKMGFEQCYGLEPMQEEIHYTKNAKNLQVYNTMLEDSNFSENSFDAITLYHTFEHIHNPVQHLQIIKKILKPGKWLVIQVPNLDSFQANFFKSNWASLDPPRHYFHYTPKSLSKLLAQNGFKVKFMGWGDNFLRPVFWGFSLKRSYPQALWKKEAEGKKTVLSRICWTILMLISIIPTEIESFFRGKAGHMTIYAINQKNENSFN